MDSVDRVRVRAREGDEDALLTTRNWPAGQPLRYGDLKLHVDQLVTTLTNSDQNPGSMKLAIMMRR